VGEILDFVEELPNGHALTIPYRGLIEEPGATGASIGRFLGLADASPISDFLISQRHAPTPFSDPVTDIADLYVIPSKPAGDDKLLALAGGAATRRRLPRNSLPVLSRFPRHSLARMRQFR
jgi:hypothetical protein